KAATAGPSAIQPVRTTAAAAVTASSVMLGRMRGMGGPLRSGAGSGGGGNSESDSGRGMTMTGPPRFRPSRPRAAPVPDDPAHFSRRLLAFFVRGPRPRDTYVTTTATVSPWVARPIHALLFAPHAASSDQPPHQHRSSDLSPSGASSRPRPYL